MTTVALTWTAYDMGAPGQPLVTRTIPVFADGAAELAAHFGEIPGVRNPRIDNTRTVELGDVPAPCYGWVEAERHEVPLFPHGYTAQAVRCPKCSQPGGMPCSSTGGGNSATVATHKARTARIAGWSNAVQEHAAMLVKTVGYHGYGRDGLFAVFEAAAAPIPVAGPKPSSPKGVRLSEAQAEEIEGYVLRGGHGSVSTAHFHGDAQHRQTVNALEAKGIVEFVENSPDGYERRMRLTEFGWAVYREHRLIIRNLAEEQIAEQVARAEQNRCLRCGEQPGVTADCESCDLERFMAREVAR